MATTITPKSRFCGKAAVKREQRGACSGTAERKQARRGFLGNGLSRTAMLFKIATLAGHRLTIPEMNRFKEVNPRQLERFLEREKKAIDKGEVDMEMQEVAQPTEE